MLGVIIKVATVRVWCHVREANPIINTKNVHMYIRIHRFVATTYVMPRQLFSLFLEDKRGR